MEEYMKEWKGMNRMEEYMKEWKGLNRMEEYMKEWKGMNRMEEYMKEWKGLNRMEEYMKEWKGMNRMEEYMKEWKGMNRMEEYTRDLHIYCGKVLGERAPRNTTASTSETQVPYTGSTEPLGESGNGGCQAQIGREGVGGGGGEEGSTISSSTTMLGRGHLSEAWGRWEALRKQHDQWTCFLCCHVRTGTIIIGIWHMLLHLLSLTFIAVVVVHPEILPHPDSSLGGLGGNGELLDVKPQDVQATNCAEMPCTLAKQGDENNNNNDNVNNNDISISWDQVNMALFITLCMFIVTLLLVYGAFRRQPSHLMPFFFLKVFDFCISSMTMIGYLSYLPNIRQLILEIPAFPLQQQLLAMNTKCLTFFAMLIFIFILMAKAYCISIVWRCYKYLMLKAQAGRSVLRYLGGVSGPVDQESQTLVMGQDLPDYDTAMADPQYRKKLSGMFPEPPPSYDMAMAALYGQLEGAREHGGTARDGCENATASSHSAAAAAQPTPTNHLANSGAEALQVLPVTTRITSSPSPPTQAA
ncbi:hypothetical protein Pcinc_020936 [Petrolisthes cinctipes]|uniref:Lysosomal-associated transmembrane protein 4A n=1 Tax=Petrolisthes cinctipes TaxID=88211 RepID=A0AAE1FIM9_PETCI|nr:hypothetical protein Pcinc_020936 [Petrolisthes cinctipes]